MIKQVGILNQLQDPIGENEKIPPYTKVSEALKMQTLLSTLEIGDSLEGMLTKLGEGQYVLQIGDQIQLPVHMNQLLELGQYLSFEVMGKEDNKLYLRPTISHTPETIPLVQKALTELDLPKTPIMQEIIDGFLQKQLPLTRDALLKTYQIHKTFDIPAKVITNLLERQEAIVQTDMHALANLKNHSLEEMTLGMNKIINTMENIEDLKQVLNVFTGFLEPEQTETLLKEPMHTLQENFQLKGNPLQKEYVLQPLGKELIEGLLERDGLEESIGVLKKVCQELLKETTQVDLKAMKENVREGQKAYEVNHVWDKLVKTLKAFKLPSESQGNLKELSENLNLLNKFSVQGEYFLFPLVYQEKETTGEIYFFKPKQMKGKDKDYLYVVLALTLPSIKNIEVHINKEEYIINITIKVNDEQIKTQIAEHLGQLQSMIDALGFTAGNMSVGLLQETSGPSQEGLFTHQLSHMDFKI